MSIYKNIASFTKWLNENLKNNCSDSIDLYLNDLVRRHGETGMKCFELSKFYTKSGNPECYYYDIEEKHNEEEDTWETTYIF